MFEITARESYDVMAVCASETGEFSADWFSSTPAEATLIDVFPSFNVPRSGCEIVGEPPALVLVSGEMKQAGEVDIGTDWDRSPAANWTYRVAVEPGIHDVIASTALVDFQAGRVEIRRRQVLDADTILAPVDTVADGHRLDFGMLDVRDAVGPLTTTMRLRTNTGTVATLSSRDDSSFAALAVGSLEPADGQWITVQSFGTPNDIDGGVRTVSQRADGELTSVGSIRFPPAPNVRTVTERGLHKLRWAEMDADWMELSEHPDCSTSTGLECLRYQVRHAATRGWLEHEQDDGFTLEPFDVPGYDPAWTLDLTAGTDRELITAVTHDGIQYTTTLIDDVAPAP